MDVLWRIAPGLLVLGHERGTPINVLGAGAEVWELLETAAAVDDIVGELATRYAAPLDTLRADVIALLVELAGAEFVIVDV